MSRKRKGGTLSDSDNETSDCKRRNNLVNTSMHEENDGKDDNYSSYSDYSLKLMVNVRRFATCKD